MLREAVHRDVNQLPDAEWVDNKLTWRRPPGVRRAVAPANALPIVILPGFGNATTDYTAPFGNAEAALATHLEARGWRVFVLPVERKDWLGVTRGLLTLGYWSSSLTTHPGYTWYLERAAAAVARALQETGAQQVHLVGHSAGGWLGRAFLGEAKYQPGAAPGTPSGLRAAGPNPLVRSITTLGTPQRPPPADKKRDMTGGAQGWVDSTYPGAFFADQGIAYTCVAGRTVRGHREFPRQREGPRIAEEYAWDSYSEVCGEGEAVEGDAVVPLSSATLDGAATLVLDGVYHSMSRIGTFDEESGVVWYGSDSVLDVWLAQLAGGDSGLEDCESDAASAASGRQAVPAYVGASEYNM